MAVIKTTRHNIVQFIITILFDFLEVYVGHVFLIVVRSLCARLRTCLCTRACVQVHDELVLEVTEDEKEQVAALVQQAMQNAVNMEIPLLAEVNFGKNWAETK